MSILDIIKSIIPLILVLGMLFGLWVLVRKYAFSLSGKKHRNIHLDVIHNQLILPKKYLSLVRVKDKLLVLGISENNISVLKELDYKDLEEDFVPQENKNNFFDLLKQNLGMR